MQSAFLFCVMSVSLGQAAPADQSAYFNFSPDLEIAIRGQSPPTFMSPPPNGATFPYEPLPGNPGAPATGFGPQDPFLTGQFPSVNPYSPQPMTLYGANGPQPYRFGFSTRFDAEYIAEEHASTPAAGRFEQVGYNLELRYTSPLAPDLIFSSTPQFGHRLWSGPDVVPLPGSVYRLGWDFELATASQAPLNFQFNFNPSLNTDFDEGLHREAWNFDASAMGLFRAGPDLMFALGVMYWDRVDNILLPMGGVVWNPDDRWEFRILFPKSRISYFLGTFGDASHWLYAGAEYRVESYQIGSPVYDREQVQSSDWRVTLGLRSDHGWYDKFVEAGWVFNREFEFKNGTPGFDVGDSFIARLGVRY